MRNNVLTLILGGGAGTRLYPLTRDRAKPAVPLAGKYRLIDVALSNCINSGLRRIFVLTQYLSASLNRHIHQSYQMDHFSQGFVESLAAEQRSENSEWFQGTADAVRKHWRTLDNHDCDLILILPGDALYRMDYQAMIAQHLASGAEVTVAANVVEQRSAHHFGLLAIDENAAITKFTEKPKTREEQEGLQAPPAMLEKLGIPGGSDMFLASMGVYLFNREVLHRWLTKTASIDFGKEIIPGCIGKNKIHAHLHYGYWEDIGTIEAFYKAHMDYLRDNPPFRFVLPESPMYTRPRILPSTRVTGALLDRCALSEGCEIGKATIRNSIIGLRARVDDHSSVEGCILMGADFYDPAPFAPWQNPNEPRLPMGIGKYCHIRRSIIDKNVRMGNDVKILNEKNVQHYDGELYTIREGIVIVPKNAVIPSGTVI